MNTDTKHWVSTWLEHIRSLAQEIGPRGSTTENEQRGAEYCAQVLRDLGFAPETESFVAARSIFQPHLLASAGMLAAFAIYPLAGRASAVVAAILSGIALASDLMELGFRDNILRRLVAKGPSQNIVATVAPADEHRQDLVLIGHIDTQRTPIIFSSARWLSAYQSFTTIAFVAFLVQVLLHILGAITQWNWIWPASGIGALCAALLAAMCLQADSTPFSHGANDNATGAGLVLALAGHLQNYPLRHTRVWLACTGCEEVQHYGAIDFFHRHRSEMVEPSALIFEMLGCDGPAWLTKEGIIIPFHADPGLVAMAEELAAEHPEWRARATSISGGNTEMADALRARVPAITISGMGEGMANSYWHQVEDTYDKMDPEVLNRAYAFTWAYVQALDARASKEPA